MILVHRIGKTCLAGLVITVVSGCSLARQGWDAVWPDDDDLRSRGWTEADSVDTEPEVYCYRTAGEPDCYREQLIGQRHRLINKDVPEPDPARRIATGQRNPANNVRRLPEAEEDSGPAGPAAVESRPLEEPAEPASAEAANAAPEGEASGTRADAASRDAMAQAVPALPEEADYTLRPDGTLVIPTAAYFPSGRAELEETGRQRVTSLGQAIAESMAQLPESATWRLRISGHTDRRPISTEQYPDNQALSQARAANVADLLAEQGIDRQRLVPVGHGAQQPLTAGQTAEGRRLNRRLELALELPADIARRMAGQQ